MTSPKPHKADIAVGVFIGFLVLLFLCLVFAAIFVNQRNKHQERMQESCVKAGMIWVDDKCRYSGQYEGP